MATRRGPVRASVRLWQTELFIVVIVVAILILSASLTTGLARTLAEQGKTGELHNATLLASHLSSQFPETVESLFRMRDQLAEFHAIYGDSAWIYTPDGSLVASAGTLAIPKDVLTQARLQGLADSPPYASVSLSANGYVVAGKAIYDSTGHRVGSVVVAGTPDSELAVLDAVKSRLWVTFWVALIAAGALGFGFSEFIGTRVRAMSKAAAAIAAGDFSQRLPVGLVPDEIRDLADSYNEMAVKLGDAFSAIQDREREITAVVASMAEGVIAFGPEGTVRIINPEAKRLLGDPDVDLVGAPARAIAADAGVLDVIEAGLSGRTVAAVVELGAWTVLLHCTPLVDEEGQASGAVLLLADVTEQKRLEDAQRRFVANASHEMRTPIAALKGLLELLEDGAKDDPQVRDDFMRTMGLEVDRLGRLVADLLTLAQLEAGTFELDVQPNSAEGLIGRVCGVMRALADRSGVELVTELPDGDATVLADRDRMVQVLLGFVDNALKHSGRGDRVIMRARRAGDRMIFEVADQGPGIDPELAPRLFDRFYRADESRAGTRGAGLGLSIAKEIADAHATTIEVSSTPGGGATFGIGLPLAE